MKTQQLPDRIEITFTEEDRQNAKEYTDNTSCLVATALKRMGFNHSTKLLVYPGRVEIGRQEYVPASYGSICASSLNKRPGDRKPHYSEAVVGKTVTLIKTDERNQTW